MRHIQPKVTIVTVTYNAEQCLENTIKSVIEQDYCSVEYIIIDGGSTDGTVDIIKKYTKYLAYWVSEPDSGIYDAMNKGIDIATGEWINFLNAGDSFIDIDTLSYISNNFQSNVDIIAGAINYILSDEKKYKKPLGPEYRYDCMFCFHQAMFTKMSIMKKNKFDANFKLAGDYEFTLKCYELGHNFKFIDMPVVNFIAGGFAERNPALGRVEDMFIQSKYLKNINDIFTKYSFSCLESYKKSNNRTLGRLLNVLFLQADKLKLKEKKFIIYGYGNLGKIIHSFYKENILFVIDQNHKELSNLYPDIKFSPQDILKKNTNQYLLITVLGKESDIQKAILEKYDYDSSKFLEFIL